MTNQPDTLTNSAWEDARCPCEDCKLRRAETFDELERRRVEFEKGQQKGTK